MTMGDKVYNFRRYEVRPITFRRAYAELKRLFGARVRRERVSRGLTQAQLCRQVDAHAGLTIPVLTYSFEPGNKMCTSKSRYTKFFARVWRDVTLVSLIAVGDYLRKLQRLSYVHKAWRPRTRSASGAALLRVQAGLTQREVAEATGGTSQVVYELEHGRKRPLKLMNAVCDLYQTGCEIFHPDEFVSEKHQGDQRHLLSRPSAEELHTQQIWTEEQRPPTPEELVSDMEELMVLRKLGRELSPRAQRVIWLRFYLNAGTTEIMNSLYPDEELRERRDNMKLYAQTSRIYDKAISYMRRNLMFRFPDLVARWQGLSG